MRKWQTSSRAFQGHLGNNCLCEVRPALALSWVQIMPAGSPGSVALWVTCDVPGYMVYLHECISGPCSIQGCCWNNNALVHDSLLINIEVDIQFSSVFQLFTVDCLPDCIPSLTIEHVGSLYCTLELQTRLWSQSRVLFVGNQCLVQSPVCCCC